MDAKVIVELLETNNSANRPFSPLLDDCRSLRIDSTKSEWSMCFGKGIKVQMRLPEGAPLCQKFLLFLIFPLTLTFFLL